MSEHQQHTIPSCIKENVSLKDRNWFKTGGCAQYFAAPVNAQEISDALTFAKMHNIPVTLLGSGANVLIHDDGVKGLVLSPANTQIEFISRTDRQVLVRAGAGVSVPDLITACLDNHALGLEEFSGIPGSVGGSVYINLHYFEHLFAHFIVSAQVINLETLTLETVDTQWFNFGYNSSKLHQKKHVLVSATFALRPADELEVAHARGRHAEIIRHRQQRYPRSHTCGSFFRNFYEHEVTIESNGKKMIYVAYYLDKLGVKGQLSVGDAIVSYQHANMIVNKGNATSDDIVQLARSMQELVLKQFGIVPTPECQLLGFEQYPFHR